jgi:lysophospholipase L1-like esterase
MPARTAAGICRSTAPRARKGEIFMTQGTRKLSIVIITGIVMLALGAGAIRPAPARAASSAQETYVALGDSYSAGAGVPPYLHDSPYPSDTDGCDRSASAWPEIVASDLGFSGPQFSFHACTGAVVADLTRTNPATGEPSQENWLTQDTRLVTLTDGGNDVGFKDVLTACGLDPNCQNDNVASLLDSKIAGIGPTLVTAYEGIANALIAKGAPGATIVVMGYPRFFPSPPPGICFTYNGPQMKWMNGEIQKMNNQIQAAVTTADNALPAKNVLYVNVYDAFIGHEECTADPYMNGVVGIPPQITSFHPNGAGNEALAQLAETSIGTILPVDVRVPKVIGLLAAAAISTIRSAGLVPIEASFIDTTCNTIGYVINQSPQAGLPRATGRPVTITVGAKPPNPCP